MSGPAEQVQYGKWLPGWREPDNAGSSRRPLGASGTSSPETSGKIIRLALIQHQTLTNSKDHQDFALVHHQHELNQFFTEMIPFYIFRILFPLVTKSSSTHEWLELRALTLSKKANSFRVPYPPASANEMSFKVPVLCFWKKNLPITSSFLNPIHINTLCI